MKNQVAIEGPYAIRNVGMDEACAELVVGAARDHAGEDDAAVEKEVDVAAVGGAGRNPAEEADAAVGAAVRWSVDLLIDDAVDAAVAADPAGNAVAQGGGKRESIRAEPVVVELSKMMPAAQPINSGQPAVVFSLIAPVLNLTHQQRRIVDPEIGSCGVDRSLFSRISIEHGDEGGPVLVGIKPPAYAGRRERIGRSAAGEVGAGDRGPIAAQEHPAVVADEELRIGGKLAEAKAEPIVEELLLEPQFGKARRRDGLDVADRDQAVEMVAAHSGRSMNLKGIAEEAQALPSGELSEIDRSKRLELALIQAAATDAAGPVAERFAGVDQPIGDPVLGEPFPSAGRIAVVGHTGRDRHGRNAIDNIRLRHRRPGHRDRRKDGNIQP